MTMVVDGHTGVEHSIPVAHVYKDVVQLWPGHGVGYTPTLIVGYGGLWGENYWYQHTNVWENERLSKFVPPFVLDPRSRRRLMAEEDDFNYMDNAKIAKRLGDAGVSIQLGAHGQREGLGAHWEMWMLVQGGMTPREALRVRDAQRRRVPRDRQGPRVARARQARRRRGHRRRPAGGHPAVREGALHDGERALVRREHAGRSWKHGETKAVLVAEVRESFVSP